MNHLRALSPFFVMLLGASAAFGLEPREVEFFESRIRPILAQECYECHSSSGKQKGGLVLDHREAMIQGGDSGALLKPGDPAKSLLMQSIRHEIDDLKMPKAGAQLEPEILADFEKWIEMGAPDPRDGPPSAEELEADRSWDAVRDRRKQWWSFQPIDREVTVPEGEGSPIDRFVKEKLGENNLHLNAKAEPRVLVRRLYFVLTGLPPTPEQVSEFLESGADADVLIDELIARPEFGERWARHWMDWVRYAETHGSEGDPKIPNAHRYRDYLIRALNADVGYDQLLKEHLAGDLLENPRVNEELQLNESAIGPAHLRFVFHGFAPTDAHDEQVRFTDDQINVFSKAFLGLTVSCARCHDHKFDAISQADFYSLYGIFTSSRPSIVDARAPGIRETSHEKLNRLKKEIKAELFEKWSQAAEKIPAELRWQPPVVQHFAEDDILMRWDLSDPNEAAIWNASGSAKWAPNGEFIVTTEGERAISSILPAAVYSHTLSKTDPGVFGSDQFTIPENAELYYRATGEGGSVARYVVRNYPRSGTVYRAISLTEPTWKWHKVYDLTYWGGDVMHHEFTTAADSATLGNPDTMRSWFGVSDAILVKKGSQLVSSSSEEESLAEAATAAVIAWNDGSLTTSGAFVLQHLLDENLLPNEITPTVEAYRKIEAAMPLPVRVPGVLDASESDAPLYTRGDHKSPTEDLVPRRFLEAIDDTPYEPEQSGRLELAADLLRQDNPFVPRVIVNRIWHHLFGKGLVRTPDNFGRMGEKPSHPELLDYLAAKFVNEGWSLKKLIREIVATETWQQSSDPTDQSREIDPGNTFLSHANIRRLEAEAIRDAVLRVSGTYQPQLFGKSATGNTDRRSIYVRVVRNNLDPFLSTFDFPTPASTVGSRDITNVPGQSLTLLNDPAIIGRAAKWATKTDQITDFDTRLTTMFETAFGRPPTQIESERSRTLLAAAETERESFNTEITALRNQLSETRQAIDSIIEPARAQLLANVKTRQAVDLKPISEWTFDNNLEDRRGNLNGSIVGSAKVGGGALILEGGFVRTAPLPKEIREKTLEVIVQLTTLDQRGGGVFTVQDRRGGVFDSIVFGEKEAGHWLSGSNNHRRTLSFEGEAEPKTETPIHLAIVYSTDGQITAYRNGRPYGKSIRKADPVAFKAKDSEVVFGLRHGTTAGGNRMFRGRIFEARLYDRALTAGEVAIASKNEHAFVNETRILETLSPEQKSQLDQLRRDISEQEAVLKKIERYQPKSTSAWADLAHALFNAKEFIYLR